MNNLPANKPVALIGYSGHGFVAADILLSAGYKVVAYCDQEQKAFNPFLLQYLGKEGETKAIDWLRQHEYFISIGDNSIREKVYTSLTKELSPPLNAIHPSAVISASVVLQQGIFIAGGAVINPLSRLGKGVICNTRCSIDHECQVDDFAHIGPGAILCGNVQVGYRSFIGAGSVVRQGTRIGKNVIIGAGSVIVKDVPDNVIIAGNPPKELTKKIKQ